MWNNYNNIHFFLCYYYYYMHLYSNFIGRLFVVLVVVSSMYTHYIYKSNTVICNAIEINNHNTIALLVFVSFIITYE